jgi:hypothetical protein
VRPSECPTILVETFHRLTHPFFAANLFSSDSSIRQSGIAPEASASTGDCRSRTRLCRSSARHGPALSHGLLVHCGKTSRRYGFGRVHCVRLPPAGLVGTTRPRLHCSSTQRPPPHVCLGAFDGTASGSIGHLSALGPRTASSMRNCDGIGGYRAQALCVWISYRAPESIGIFQPHGIGRAFCPTLPLHPQATSSDPRIISAFR